MDLLAGRISTNFAEDEPMTKFLGLNKETVKKYCFDPVLKLMDKKLCVITENLYKDEVFGG